MINSVRVKNFKCFETSEIPFGPLTLLTGVNSSGKSTTIQTLLLLRQSWLKDFEEVGLNGGLMSLGTANDALSEDANEDQIEIEVHGSGIAMELAFFLPKGRENFQIVTAPNVRTPHHFGLFGSCFQYLRAERLGPRTHPRSPAIM